MRLGDDKKAVGVAGMHDVSGIHLTQANASADGRRNFRIGDLQIRRFHRRLVGFDRGFVLRHERGLRVKLLFGNGFQGQQTFIAFEIDLGVPEHRLIAGEFSLGLIQQRLVRPRINLRQNITLRYILSFLKMNRHQLPVDAAVNRRGIKRGNRPQAVQINGDISLPRSGGRYGNGRPAAFTFINALVACIFPIMKMTAMSKNIPSVGQNQRERRHA